MGSDGMIAPTVYERRQFRRAHCAHPPARLFTWYSYDGAQCVACCDCGAVLRGAL